MDVDEWMPGRSSARGLLYKVYRSPECFVAWHAGAQVCHPTLGGVGWPWALGTDVPWFLKLRVHVKLQQSGGLEGSIYPALERHRWKEF